MTDSGGANHASAGTQRRVQNHLIQRTGPPSSGKLPPLVIGENLRGPLPRSDFGSDIHPISASVGGRRRKNLLSSEIHETDEPRENFPAFVEPVLEPLDALRGRATLLGGKIYQRLLHAPDTFVSRINTGL